MWMSRTWKSSAGCRSSVFLAWNCGHQSINSISEDDTVYFPKLRCCRLEGAMIFFLTKKEDKSVSVHIWHDEQQSTGPLLLMMRRRDPFVAKEKQHFASCHAFKCFILKSVGNLVTLATSAWNTSLLFTKSMLVLTQVATTFLRMWRDWRRCWGAQAKPIPTVLQFIWSHLFGQQDNNEECRWDFYRKTTIFESQLTIF